MRDTRGRMVTELEHALATLQRAYKHAMELQDAEVMHWLEVSDKTLVQALRLAREGQ